MSCRKYLKRLMTLSLSDNTPFWSKIIDLFFYNFAFGFHFMDPTFEFKLGISTDYLYQNTGTSQEHLKLEQLFDMEMKSLLSVKFSLTLKI